MLANDQSTKTFFAADEYCQLFERNMKSVLMMIYDKIMLRKRSVIECMMDSLKNVCLAKYVRHRSLHGFVINVLAAIGAYHYLPKKPFLFSQFEVAPDFTLQLAL